MLYFAATGAAGTELWRSNGTAAGTIQIKDINPGSYGSNLNSLRAIGSTIYFQANDGVHGAELWKSTGSSASTVMVEDILPAPKALTHRPDTVPAWQPRVASCSLLPTPMKRVYPFAYG